MRKTILLALVAFASRLASASEVTAEQAQAAVDEWLRYDPALGCALGRAAESARTCTATNGAAFHVVKLAGGGFVVTSADTRLEPVIAFSDGDDLVESDANPLWILLKKDLALRAGASVAAKGTGKASGSIDVGVGNEAKWSRLLGGGSRPVAKAYQGQSSVSDLRVAPLVQSKWNQDDVGGGHCYNYYTPNNYVCGCVATAGAQIMRYFQWPRSTVNIAKFTNPYCKVNGVAQTLTTQGGTCDWSLMPLVPNSSITEAQRQAIGKLTSDLGICVGMAYAETGSSVGGYMLAEAFTNRFGYAGALALQWSGDKSGTDDLNHALMSNLDAGLPVEVGIGIDGAKIGHSIVGDGYGYSDGTLYYHFNMGWSGQGNAWYAPPALGNFNGAYNVVDGVVCNVFTNSADKGGVICSGRVLDATGSPIEGAIVSAKKSGRVVGSATTNAKGIYAFVFTGLSSWRSTSYTLTATSGGSSATKSVSLKANVGTRIITSGSSFGSYYSGTPTVGNRSGQDITIAGVAGVAEPQFEPASCLFYPSTNVTLTCATEGATIRYTLDGSEPTEASAAYTGPIFIDDDTEIKARAWKDGLNPSSVAVETYTYDAAQDAPKGDYFADPINISGTSGTRVIADNSAYTVEDGEPKHTRRPSGNGYTYNYQYHTVWYKWTAPGSGTMIFQTYCSGDRYIYPTYIAVYTGDMLALDNRAAFAYEYDESSYITTLSLDVEQGVTYRIVGMMGYDGSGTFTLAWSGDLTVAPTATSTEVPVPYSWLDALFPGQGGTAESYDTLANADSDGDGLPNWAEYVCGTSPTNADDKLTVTIRMDDGQPVVETSLDGDTVQDRGFRIVTKGTNNLADWEDVVDAKTSTNHFFKVVIEPKE